MAIFSISNISTIFYILVPGYVLYKSFIHLSRLDKERTKIEEAVSIFAAGLIANVFAVIIWNFLPADLKIIELKYMTDNPAPRELINVGGALTAVSLGLGALGGKITDKTLLRNRSLTRGSIWRSIFLNANEPVKVKIDTEDDYQFKGIMKNFEERAKSQDVVIGCPVRKSLGEDEKFERMKSNYIYFKEDNIRRISVENEVE